MVSKTVGRTDTKMDCETDGQICMERHIDGMSARHMEGHRDRQAGRQKDIIINLACKEKSHNSLSLIQKHLNYNG